MGLERKIETVLTWNGISRDRYYFDRGLRPETPEDAGAIQAVLDASDHFGPTRYDPATGEIEIGMHFTHFLGSSEEYEQERQKFLQHLPSKIKHAP